MGQGYADVLVPPGGGGWLWGRAADNNPLQMPPNDWQDRHPDMDNANIPQQPTVEVSEEQVWINFYNEISTITFTVLFKLCHALFLTHKTNQCNSA